MFLNTDKKRGEHNLGVEVHGDLTTGGLKFERWNKTIIMIPQIEWIKLADHLIKTKTTLIEERFGKSKKQIKCMLENVVREHKKTIEYLEKEIAELDSQANKK